MTRAEIERAVLELPQADRAALTATLLESLPATERQAMLRPPLTDAERRELQSLKARLDPQIESWFQGEGREWTQEDWEALFRGESRHEPETDSLAVPPGWRPA